MARQCDVCSKPLSKRQTNYCCLTCQYKGRRTKDRKGGIDWRKRYAACKEHRCPDCGAKITTRNCFACDTQRKQDQKLELERHIKNENAELRERFGCESVAIEDTGRESAQVRGSLYHPDIIETANRRDGVRDAGPRSDTPAKRRRKRNRGDTGLGTDKQRSAAG